MTRRRRSRPKDQASLDKYGASIATVLAVGATVWAFFRVGFKIQDGVKKLKRNGQRTKKSSSNSK